MGDRFGVAARVGVDADWRVRAEGVSARVGVHAD